MKENCLKHQETIEYIREYDEMAALQERPYGSWREHVERAAEDFLKKIRQEAQGDLKESRLISYDCFREALESIDEDACYVFARDVKMLTENASEQLSAYFYAYPRVQVIYGTEELISTQGKAPGQPWLKPGFSPETLLSFFYMGSYVAIRGAALLQYTNSYPDWRELKDTGKKALYHCLLALFLQSGKVKPALEQDQIYVVDEVLYHMEVESPEKCHFTGIERETQQSQETLEQLEADQALVQPEDTICLKNRQLIERLVPAGGRLWGYEREYDDIKKTFYADLQISTQRTWPKVSVLIPDKDYVEVLETCLDTLVNLTDYPELEIIVVDNGSSEENRLWIATKLKAIDTTIPAKQRRDLCQSFAGNKKIQLVEDPYEKVITTQYLYEPMEFNFSKMCNLAASKASGELLLLLNNDIEIVQPDWLKLMAGEAMLQSVGAVGAKLMYPGCNRLQHAGVYNLEVGPVHMLSPLEDNSCYYDGRNLFHFNLLCVTAACLLVRKEVYQEAQGLCQELQVAYNDVDFCYRLYDLGYRNVQRNDCVLIHHESLSRGDDTKNTAKWQRNLKERQLLYGRHWDKYDYDPYYNKNLSGNHTTFQLRRDYLIREQLKPVEEPKQIFLKEEAWNSLLQTPRELPGGLKGKLLQKWRLLTVEPHPLIYNMDSCMQLREKETGRELLALQGWGFQVRVPYQLYETRILMVKEELISSEKSVYMTSAVYELPTWQYYREDVSQLLQKMKPAPLCGFRTKMYLESFPKGTYRIALMYQNRVTGEAVYRLTNTSFQYV